MLLAIVSLWVPALVIVVTWGMWSEHLPSELPMHWGSSGPADAVTAGERLVANMNASQNERSVFAELMYIVAESDTHEIPLFLFILTYFPSDLNPEAPKQKRIIFSLERGSGF